MSSSPEINKTDSAESPKKEASDVILPPVQPPNVGFIFQLFLIPLVIVSIIVSVWLMFSWIAHSGVEPKDLVTGLKQGGDASWQKAGILAEMLRDPQQDSLRDDPLLARDLVRALEEHLDTAAIDDNSIKMRVFLCKALGEFRVKEVLDVLSRAAVQENDPVEADVRRTAIEAIAVLASNVGLETIQQSETTMNALMSASVDRGPDGDDPQRRAKLRERAAFALGVVSGEAALNRLELLFSDPHPNVRFNAAIGLARHGDLRSKRVLLEMLDPQNPDVIQGEEGELSQNRKRVLVITNAIRAGNQLIEKNPQEDFSDLQTALERLLKSDAPKGVRNDAQEAVYLLQSQQAESS